MFLLNRDPFMVTSPHVAPAARRVAADPCAQYHKVRQDLDDLLVPAMYLLQHLTQPQSTTVIPKQPEEDKNNFVVKVDVSHFSPEEISVTVKSVDKDGQAQTFLVVEGKHDERGDELGYISRQFTRRYEIPKGVQEKNITCHLSSDGVLILSAPREVEEQKQSERPIPINLTGQPAVTSAAKSTPTPAETPKSGGDPLDEKVQEKADTRTSA